ncbi:MAG: ATP-binding protein [Pricia sp.]
MLKQLKENFSHSHLQFILTDAHGIVVDCDRTVLQVTKGIQIGDIHPFFLGIPEIMASAGKSTIFRSVQLGTAEKILTVDIDISMRQDHILFVVYDLTDHYREYQAMAQARNESVIASERISMQNDELQEREQFKNEFIQNFSHELRNPLTNIISLSNILGRTELNDEQQKTLQVLKESTANLKLMLEDVLSISMIAKGKLALNPSVFYFPQLMEFLKLTYATRAREKGLAFAISTDEKIPEYVEGDRLRLLQILTNLCDNAVKYTAKGTIELEVALNQKRADTINLRFGVRDTGSGIPPEHLETIFESFEQLGPTEGAGLGLAIVKGLLTLMGSDIRIDSQAGSGSYFYFDTTLKFPLHQPEAPIFLKRMEKAGGTSHGTSKFRVLLVEDDAQVQKAIFKTLVDAGRFFIDVVSDGALVVEEIVNNAYDIILMDVNLPNVSGDQVVKVIRSLPTKKYRNIPIIGITASTHEERVAIYRKAGMNLVIAKPFDEEELLQAMYRLLR